MRKEEARTILGVAEGDSDTVIKKAYRKLALKNHPDKNKGSDESKKKFQQISEAYKCLTDPNYEDEAEGFGDINEEEMFEMFNEMFSAMFGGGSMMEAMFGGDEDAGFGFFPSGGGDLLDLEDLSEEESMKAEAFIANGDQAGFMQYMNKLQRKKDEETRQNRAGNGGKVSKSTSSSKAKGGGGDKSKSTSRRARGGSKFGTEEDMMEEMMMSMMMGGDMMGADEDDMAAMASMMFGDGLDGKETMKPIDSDEEEILADLMAGMTGMGLGRSNHGGGRGAPGGSGGLEEAMMAAFMQDMMQGDGALDDYSYDDDDDIESYEGRRRKVKVRGRGQRAPTSAAGSSTKRTRPEGLDY